MKRIVATLLVFVMLLSMCACGSAPQTTVPSQDPSSAPTEEPTSAPTEDPTTTPTEEPTDTPTENPTEEPTNTPAEPHSHAYGDWKVEKEATCTATGTKTRSCSCGDKQSETIPMTDHNYVDGICKECGKENFSRKLKVLDSLQIEDLEDLYYCSEKVIVYKANEKCYMADHTGKVLTPNGYRFMACPNPDGFVVASNLTTEVIDVYEDPELGKLYTTRTVYDTYVLNDKGAVVFQRQYTVLEAEMDKTTYTGEYIAFCNEDRIVTYTSDTYYFGSADTSLTVNIYDMSGKRLAQIEDVYQLGIFLNGQLPLIVNWGTSLLVVDKNGKELHSNHYFLPEDWYYTAFASSNWTDRGFINGYLMIKEEWGNRRTMLISDNLSKSYMIRSEYLANAQHNGTLVASKIVTGNSISEEYYLIDLAKCSKDADGCCIPTIDAAISRQGYDEIYISCLFGTTEPYALVTRNDQWGYLAMDGSVEKLYDDAGSFHNGNAIVRNGDRIYIIDENFKQISNSITGYTSVTSAFGSVFTVRKDNVIKVAVLY